MLNGALSSLHNGGAVAGSRERRTVLTRRPDDTGDPADPPQSVDGPRPPAPPNAHSVAVSRACGARPRPRSALRVQYPTPA